jgi:hypothetical protein
VSELPSGTVTFLFTDVEGSTRLWEEYPEAMRPALARHDELLRAAVADHQGHVVKTTGDGFNAAFAMAADAVAAAIAAQLALSGESWAETGPLRVPTSRARVAWRSGVSRDCASLKVAGRAHRETVRSRVKRDDVLRRNVASLLSCRPAPTAWTVDGRVLPPTSNVCRRRPPRSVLALDQNRTYGRRAGSAVPRYAGRGVRCPCTTNWVAMRLLMQRWTPFM